MTELLQPFDALQYDPSQSVGNLPVGKHPVVIDSVEVKAVKDNAQNGYIEFTLRITDGPQVGCTGAYRINLYNQNPTTVAIAQKQLSALCHVIGTYQVKNLQVMCGKPFFVEVGPQKNDPTYTEVKKVFDVNQNEPKRGQAPTAAQQQQPWGSGAPQQQATPSPMAAQETQPQANSAPPWGQQQAAPAEQPSQQQAPVQQSAPQQSAPAWGAPAPAQGGWGAPAQQQQAPVQNGQQAAPPWGQQQ